MQNWNDLVYCLALAEYKTLSAAAKALQTNPTTVSRHVQNVSERYRQSVFKRDGQEWRPTELGERLIRIASNIKNDIDTLEAESQGSPEGTLRIFCEMRLMQSYLAHNWSALLHSNPKVNLNVSLYDSSLAFGEVDISITSKPPTEGRLVRKKIAEQEFAVYASKIFEHQIEGWIELLEQNTQKLDQTSLQATYGRAPRLSLHGLNLALQSIRELPYAVLLPRSIASAMPDLCEIDGHPVIKEMIWASYHESRRNDELLRNVFDQLGSIN